MSSFIYRHNKSVKKKTNRNVMQRRNQQKKNFLLFACIMLLCCISLLWLHFCMYRSMFDACIEYAWLSLVWLLCFCCHLFAMLVCVCVCVSLAVERGGICTLNASINKYTHIHFYMYMFHLLVAVVDFIVAIFLAIKAKPHIVQLHSNVHINRSRNIWTCVGNAMWVLCVFSMSA